MEGFPQSFGSSRVGLHWKALIMFSKMILNRAGLATILTPCGRLQGWQPGQEKKKKTKQNRRGHKDVKEKSSQPHGTKLTHEITGAGCWAGALTSIHWKNESFLGRARSRGDKDLWLSTKITFSRSPPGCYLSHMRSWAQSSWQILHPAKKRSRERRKVLMG